MIVADSSPLISLGRIGHLRLVHLLFGTAIIPNAVSQEINQRPEGFPGGRPDWIQNRSVDESPILRELRLAVDPGEAEAIALAVQLNAQLIIDDGAGRRVAASLGVDFTGTLGILLLVKDRGHIERVDVLLDGLMKEDFYVSARVAAEVLRLAEEAT